YVTKSSEPAVLVRAIRSVARGERSISDDVARALAEDSLSPSRDKLEQLGEREIEILRQLAAGATKEQLASNLNLSTTTVQNYHYLTKAKTGMRPDAMLVRLAVKGGRPNLKSPPPRSRGRDKAVGPSDLRPRKGGFPYPDLLKRGVKNIWLEAR